MKNAFADVLLLASGIISLALIAVLVGHGSNTAAVIGSAGTAFSNSIKAAVAPLSASAN